MGIKCVGVTLVDMTNCTAKVHCSSRKCCQLSSTDYGCAFIAPRVHLSQTKLTSRCDDRNAVTEFSLQSLKQSSRGNEPIFIFELSEFLYNNAGPVKGSHGSISKVVSIQYRFVTDGQTHTDTGQQPGPTTSQ